MAELLTVDSLLAFLTLAALEIVLGVDNLVFIAILSGRVEKSKQALARNLGLAMAAIGRLILLFAIAWVVSLDKAVIYTFFEGGERETAITVKDLILILGGIFLIGKATWEIHHKIEGARAEGTEKGKEPKPKASMAAVVGQIFLLDLVFSIDSVLTAIGMVNPNEYESAAIPFTGIPWPPLAIMSTAVILAIAVMLGFAGPLSRFIERHPTFKMLALSFLLLIGVVLVAEGLHQHIPRGYIYFAMGFSLLVQLLNLRLSSGKKAREEARASNRVAGEATAE